MEAIIKLLDPIVTRDGILTHCACTPAFSATNDLDGLPYLVIAELDGLELLVDIDDAKLIALNVEGTVDALVPFFEGMTGFLDLRVKQS